MSEDGDRVPFFAFFANTNYAPTRPQRLPVTSADSRNPRYTTAVAGWVTGRPAASG